MQELLACVTDKIVNKYSKGAARQTKYVLNIAVFDSLNFSLIEYTNEGGGYIRLL